MRRGFAVVLASFFLGACALPLQVQVASWALDGVSYLATNKSLSDHGLSFVLQQDCAVLRLVVGDALCTEEAPDVMVADAGPTDFLGGAGTTDEARPTMAGSPEAIVRVAMARGGNLFQGTPETLELPGFQTAAAEPAGEIRNAADAAEIQELTRFETAAGGPSAPETSVTKAAGAKSAGVADLTLALSPATGSDSIQITPQLAEFSVRTGVETGTDGAGPGTLATRAEAPQLASLDATVAGSRDTIKKVPNVLKLLGFIEISRDGTGGLKPVEITAELAGAAWTWERWTATGGPVDTTAPERIELAGLDARLGGATGALEATDGVAEVRGLENFETAAGGAGDQAVDQNGAGEPKDIWEYLEATGGAMPPAALMADSDLAVQARFTGAGGPFYPWNAENAARLDLDEPAGAPQSAEHSGGQGPVVTGSGPDQGLQPRDGELLSLAPVGDGLDEGLVEAADELAFVAPGGGWTGLGGDLARQQGPPWPMAPLHAQIQETAPPVQAQGYGKRAPPDNLGALWPVSGPGNVYLVFATYSSLADAETGVRPFARVGARVLARRLAGRAIYRGVIGPLAGADRALVKRRVAGQGLRHTWAMRADAADWVPLAAKPLPVRPGTGLPDTLAELR